MNEYAFDEILLTFNKTAKKNGFNEKERQKLVSPYFTNEFNLSAGHHYLKPVLSSEQKEDVNRILVNEPCLRRMDIERIMSSSIHLLLFEMGVFGAFGYIEEMRVEESAVIKTLLEFIERIGIDISKLVFTTSLGAKINEQYFEEDYLSYQILIRQGIRSDKIIKTYGRQNFIYSKGEDRPSGYSVEVFYDNSGGEFIEIASINIYKYLFKGGELIPNLNNVALGCGVGFERILAIKNNVDSVFKLDPFCSFAKNCETLFESSQHHTILKKRLAMIMELIKSLSFIIYDGQMLDNTPKGRIAKSFLRKLNSEITYVNLPYEKVLDFGIYNFQKYYRTRYNINDDECNKILSIMKNNLKN